MANKSVFASIVGKLMPSTDALNYAGGPAYAYTPRHTLAQIAATGTFGRTSMRMRKGSWLTFWRFCRRSTRGLQLDVLAHHGVSQGGDNLGALHRRRRVGRGGSAAQEPVGPRAAVRGEGRFRRPEPARYGDDQRQAPCGNWRRWDQMLGFGMRESANRRRFITFIVTDPCLLVRRIRS